MQTEFLYEFVAVAKCLNYRKAAEAVHVSASAISKHIASLEKELGFELFDRSRGMSLTPAGEYFYSRVSHVLNEIEDAVGKSREVAQAASPVRVLWLGQGNSFMEKLAAKTGISFNPVMADPMMPHLSYLGQDKVDVTTMYDIELNKSLTEAIRREDFKHVELGKNELSLIVSRDSPLGKKESLSHNDLKNAEFLAPYGAFSDCSAQGVSAVFGEDLDVKVVQDPSLLVGLGGFPVRDPGRRISLNYRENAKHACEQRPDLVFFDTLDGKPITTREYAVYRSDNANPNVELFVERLLELVEKS